MTARTLDFNFAKNVGSQSGGLRQPQGGVGGGLRDYFDVYAPTKMTPSFGRMILTDGSTPPQQAPWGISLGVGLNSSVGVTDLVMTAPIYPIVPLLGEPGTGNIYGSAYRWFYRWKNSRSGDVSGLSPAAVEGLNLGLPLTGGTVVGQIAYIRITTALSPAAPAFADTIQVFRTTSGRSEVKFLVGEKLFTAGDVVTFIDNFADDELIATDVTAGLNPNPAFDEGPIPSFVKSMSHSIGRLVLYGMRRMGPYRSGTCAVTAGSPTVTLSGTQVGVLPERIGQSFRLRSIVGGATINDPTVYRIVDLDASTGRTLYVTPPVKRTDQMTADVYSGGAYYELLDDRDLRLIQPSFPGLPGNFDLLEGIFVGADRDDTPLHVWQMNDKTWAQTGQAIYLLDNFETDSPSTSVFIRKVASEGTTGFDSGCLTPLGWVYLHPLLGIRLFDGQSPPRPLGSQSSLAEFLPKTQFQGGDSDAYSSATLATYSGFNPTLLSVAMLRYDPREHLIHCFYVPNGSWSSVEELSLDPTTGAFRGPWRRCATAGDLMKNADGADLFVFGDDVGNLWLDNQQDLDLLNGATGSTVSATDGYYYMLIDSGAPFDATTYKQQGVPIYMVVRQGATDPVGSAYLLTRIVDVIDTSTLVLENTAPPQGVSIDDLKWSYILGAIRWFWRSAFVDVGEAINPKIFKRWRARFRRGAASCSTATGGVLLDGQTALSAIVGEDGSTTAMTLNPASVAHYDVYANCGSRLFAFAWYGTSTTCDPQITGLVADIEVSDGA